MKKWLNIKQKVCDFSEDEADTETESEDEGMNFSIYYRFLFLFRLIVFFSLFSSSFFCSSNLHAYCSVVVSLIDEKGIEEKRGYRYFN